MTAHPISRLTVDSFGAFSSAEASFSSNLNVIVGENGAGKSQLLKLLYSVTSVLSRPDPLSPDAPRRTALNVSLAEKLVGVFQPETLGRLTNRRRGRTRCEVSVEYAGLGRPVAFSFASSARTEVKTDESPDRWVKATAAYLPTRELLSIYPGFVSLYNERRLEFDATWADTADLLGRPVSRGPRPATVSAALDPIEEALGGSITEEGGRFYLTQPGVGQMEMHLVAEGLRKLGMLVRLVASGTLSNSGYLFWDEPEANLNPRTLRLVAQTIFELSRAGVQVFIATHSLFLLREFEILLAHQTTSPEIRDISFLGLHRTSDGVTVQQGPRVEDVGDISALDEELSQSSRYLQTVD